MSKAQEILEEVIKNESLFDPNIGFTPHLAFCELLLQEFKTSRERSCFRK